MSFKEPSRIKVEVCVESLLSATIAEQSGADRIELNSAIGLGGLTPSIDLLRMVKHKVHLPVICMVRPRPGDFLYSDQEFELMQADASSLLSAGADGLAAGFLDQNGQVDTTRTERFKETCRSSEFVFHRAFDCASDLDQAMRQLVGSGVTRVLTSGGRPTAEQGQEMIKKLNAAFGREIEILPGSGITSFNAAALVRNTGCDQIHGTFSSISNTGSRFVPEINFNELLGLDFNQKRESDARAIQETVKALSSI